MRRRPHRGCRPPWSACASSLLAPAAALRWPRRRRRWRLPAAAVRPPPRMAAASGRLPRSVLAVPGLAGRCGCRRALARPACGRGRGPATRRAVGARAGCSAAAAERAAAGAATAAAGGARRWRASIRPGRQLLDDRIRRRLVRAPPREPARHRLHRRRAGFLRQLLQHVDVLLLDHRPRVMALEEGAAVAAERRLQARRRYRSRAASRRTPEVRRRTARRCCAGTGPAARRTSRWRARACRAPTLRAPPSTGSRDTTA